MGIYNNSDASMPSITSILPDAELPSKKYLPVGTLEPFVECYWSLEVAEPPVSVDIVPDGLVDITFVFGERNDVFVTGPRRTPATYVHHYPISLLGVCLRPGVARLILDADISSLKQEWVPLSELIGDFAQELFDRVDRESFFSGRLAVIETFLIGRLADRGVDSRVTKAIETILNNCGNMKIDKVSRKSGSCSRNLGRLFDNWIGLSPKMFSRIARMQTAIRALVKNPRANLSVLALELGYSDQAHLTRELRDLTNASPRELANPVR